MSHKTTLWSSPFGDFCIQASSHTTPETLLKTLEISCSLIPPNLKKIAFLDASCLQQNPKKICTAFEQYQFSEIYIYPSIETPRNSKIALTVCSDLEKALTLYKQKNTPHALFFCSKQVTSYQKLCSIMEGSPPPNHLNIDLSALASNIDTIKSHTGSHTRLLVMVKANGYGSEDAIVSRFLNSCHIDIVGVAHAEEAQSLRLAGIKQNIFIINASEYEMDKVALADAEVGVYTAEQIIAAHNAGLKWNKVIPLHLHIDTGMKRFGSHPKHAIQLASLIQSLSSVSLCGIFSHFPAADDPAHDDFSKEQVTQFLKTVELIQAHDIAVPCVHIANSVGTFRFPTPLCTMVRVGISLYGYSSSSSLSFSHLKPALSLETTVAGLVEAEHGETVSYGRRFKVPHTKGTIAVLPLGYYDGLHRLHSGKQTVRIKSHNAPLVGTICMDYMMADVTSIPHVATGDKVLIFGKDDSGHTICPLEFAERGGSIVHEFLTCLGPRIRRRFYI